MSSFIVKYVTHVVSVEWRGYLGEGGKGWNEAYGNEAVDSQHETGAGLSSHPRTKDYPK